MGHLKNNRLTAESDGKKSPAVVTRHLYYMVKDIRPMRNLSDSKFRKNVKYGA